MWAFIGRRLLVGVLLLFVASSLAFLLMNANTGNIALNLLGQNATDEQLAAKTIELGLDQPLLVRYGAWLASAVRGDLGVSWFSHTSVWTAVLARLPVTLSLVIGTTLVTAVLGVVFGVLAAARRGWVDRVVQVVSVIGAAVPGFWLGLMLVIFFSLQLHWFPATGFTRPTDSIGGWLWSITLPVIALSTGTVSAVAQQVRSAFIAAEQRDYVRTLRSRGLGEGSVLFGHVLRSAAPPALTVLGLQFVALLSASVVIERVFALPGLGQAITDATVQGDVPVVLGIVLISVALVVVVNLLIDIVNGWINPKARIS